MKKQEDARLAVLREYDSWAKHLPNDAKKMGGYVFFGYLEKEKPDLLDFRAAGSKWQIVHLWLRHGGRLKEQTKRMLGLVIPPSLPSLATR